MKRTRFFEGIALTACVLALFLVIETGFISNAYGAEIFKYGYLKLRDADSDMIKSDLIGQYMDYHIRKINGEDIVILRIDSKSKNLTVSDFKCGWPPSSTRRVLMDLPFGNQIAPIGSTEEKFLNFLRSQNLNDPLNPIAHLQGYISISGSIDFIDFIADTITRKDLWAYGIPDAVLTQYRFSSYTGLAYENQHLIYDLDYAGATVTEVVNGKTWAFDVDGSTVILFVYKNKSGANPPIWESGLLATYESLPFGYTTSISSLGSSSGAPRKYDMLSASWGKIKESFSR